MDIITRKQQVGTIMSRRHLILCLTPSILLFIGGIVAAVMAPIQPFFFNYAEKKAGVTNSEEGAVREYIMKECNDPTRTEFTKWGPHDLTGDMGFHWEKGQRTKLIRVCYRARDFLGQPHSYDELFAIQSGKVVGRVWYFNGHFVAHGGKQLIIEGFPRETWQDNWPALLRKDLAGN